MRHKVVVVGASLMGVKAARELALDRRLDVTLISGNTEFQFNASLIDSLNINFPLRKIFDRSAVNFVFDRVTTVRNLQKEVTGEKDVYPYDQLVWATHTSITGQATQLVPEVMFISARAEDNTRLKKCLLASLTNHHRSAQRIVVVGGGKRGVELAANVSEFLRIQSKKMLVASGSEVTIIEAAPRLLPQYSEKFARTVARRLKKLGITTLSSTSVKSLKDGHMQLPDELAGSVAVIWTPRAPQSGTNPDKAVWHIGEELHNCYPQCEGMALYDGAYLATAVKASIDHLSAPVYQPNRPALTMSVGQRWAAVDMRGVQLFGLVGWVVSKMNSLYLLYQILPLRMAVRAWLSMRL